jgi:hypothetical protein
MRIVMIILISLWGMQHLTAPGNCVIILAAHLKLYGVAIVRCRKELRKAKP